MNLTVTSSCDEVEVVHGNALCWILVDDRYLNITLREAIPAWSDENVTNVYPEGFDLLLHELTHGKGQFVIVMTGKGYTEVPGVVTLCEKNNRLGSATFIRSERSDRIFVAQFADIRLIKDVRYQLSVELW